MIRDTIFHGIVQLPHGHREMGSEPVALSCPPRILDEWLNQDPVQLEPTYKSSIIAGERVGRSKAFRRPLIAVRQSPFLRRKRPLALASEIECLIVGEAKLLHGFEQGVLPVVP